MESSNVLASRSIDCRRRRLEQARSLHWFHWVVIALSLGITLIAWIIVNTEEKERNATRFDRECGRVADLILERMNKYADALQAGASFIQTIGGDVAFDTWQNYAKTIRIEEKYPGINGLGVIHHVPPENLMEYLAEQRIQRPHYAIKPSQSREDYWPISYIIPVEGNEEAVGLDMAHESNRYQAALHAKATGKATITGPIVLVQDEGETPGFLFFNPFYRNPPSGEKELVGLIYAPFVVIKLMEGVLSQDARHVNLAIKDGNAAIYDEHRDPAKDHDPKPLYEKTIKLSLFGREWQLDFKSGASFRDDAHSYQPALILIGGLVVDGLLLLLFYMHSRSSRQTLAFADDLTQELRDNKRRLEQANEELMQFNHRTSHDLAGPIRSIMGFARIAKEDLKSGNQDGAIECIRHIDTQSTRLDELIERLLEISKVDLPNVEASAIDMNNLIQSVFRTLKFEANEKNVELRATLNIDRSIVSIKPRIMELIEDLVSNGIKFCNPTQSNRFVDLTVSTPTDRSFVIRVADNGIGIPSDQQRQVFDLFFKADNNVEHGSGLGLYLCKKHLSYLGGEIAFESDQTGTVFTATIPNASASPRQQASSSTRR